MTEQSSTISTPITQIRDRLEAKAGAVSGTREYWDCVAALLDVAEAAQVVSEWANVDGFMCLQCGYTSVHNPDCRFEALANALDQLKPQDCAES